MLDDACHIAWEEADQGRHHPRELGVTGREVARPVQLVEEKAGSRRRAVVGQ